MHCLGSGKFVVAKTKVFIYSPIVKQRSKPTWISSFTQTNKNIGDPLEFHIKIKTHIL